MMNEYIFNKIDCDNDKYWVIKSFFNSLNLSGKLLESVSNKAQWTKINWVIEYGKNKGVKVMVTQVKG